MTWFWHEISCKFIKQLLKQYEGQTWNKLNNVKARLEKVRFLKKEVFIVSVSLRLIKTSCNLYSSVYCKLENAVAAHVA